MDSPSPPNPTAGPLALPTELIAHIASFLPKEDLLTLRLTSRQCQQTTQLAFVSAFFSTVATDLCKPSLERLARIAQDPQLGPRVRTVFFAGSPHVRCRLPTAPDQGHLPGSGYDWRRIGQPSRALPPQLNPDPEANPAIALLQTALAALPNLHTLAVDPDLGANPELHIPTTTGLCVLDVLHLALLGTAAVPLKRFLILRGELGRLRAQALVPPRAALVLPTWGAHLVELALVARPMPTPAEDAEHWALLAGMVRQARGLRKLVVVNVRWGFYEVLVAVLEEEGEAGMPPLEVLEMQRLGTVRRADLLPVLGRFVLGFRRSLRHVCLGFAGQGAASVWKGVLAEWAAGLECLRSFHLRHLWGTRRFVVVGRPPRPWMLVFDGITEWAGSDGVPDKGTVEFASWTMCSGKERVTDFRFACAEGREGERDAQNVLGKLAEVVRVEEARRNSDMEQEATRLTRIEKRFLIGGKLEANYSTAIESPELDIA